MTSFTHTCNRFLVVVALVAGSGCGEGDQRGTEWRATRVPDFSPNTLMSRIRGTLSECGGLEDPGAPTRVPAFTQTVLHGSKWADAVVSILQDHSCTDVEKQVAVMVVQRAPLNEYLDILERVLDGVDARRMSVIDARWVVFPLQEWSVVIESNFQNAEVRSLLHRFRAMDPDSASSIDAILEGRSWESTQRLVSSGSMRFWK